MRTEEEVYKMVSGAVMSSLKNSGIPAFFIYDENDPRLKEIKVLLHVGYEEEEKKVWRQKTTFDNALENQALWGGTGAYLRFKMANPDYEIEIEGRYEFVAYNAKKDERVSFNSIEEAQNRLSRMLSDVKLKWDLQEALQDVKDPRAVEPLVAALKDGDKDVRNRAASALGQTKAPRAVEPLVARLKDDQESVRVSAARSLGEIKGSQAVEPLIVTLKDPSPEVRCSAAIALGEIKDSRAIEPLITALKDQNTNVRRDAIKALAAFKHQQALVPLIAAMKDDDWVVRRDAARALGDLNNPQAIQSLIVALKDENLMVQEAAEAALREVKNFGPTESPITPKIEKMISTKEEVSKLLSERENAALAALSALLVALNDHDPSVRSQAAMDLGRKKDPRALEPLIIALRDQEPDVRWRSAWALGMTNDTRAVEPLITALKDRDWKVRSRAADSLGKIKDNRAVDPLIAALSDQDPIVRQEASGALGKIKDYRAVEPLIATLKDKDMRVQQGAAVALTNITGKFLGTNHVNWQRWWEGNKGNFIKKSVIENPKSQLGQEGKVAQLEETPLEKKEAKLKKEALKAIEPSSTGSMPIDKGTPDIDWPYPRKEQLPAPPIEQSEPVILSVYSQLRLPKYEICRQVPDPSPEMMALPGRWQGIWDMTGTPSALIIQKIEGRKVDLIYAWGFWGPMKERQPSHVEITGDLAGPEPVIKFQYADARYTFTMEEGKLIGLQQQPNMPADRVVMVKVE
jgi:HEAT repeat protein